MNPQRTDARIEARNSAEALVLREDIVRVIMRNRWLAAEVARQWVERNGFYLMPKATPKAQLRDSRR